MDNKQVNIFKKQQKFYPSKKMGQNFLVDNSAINKIIDNVPNLYDYDLILEIGPGLGAITDSLVKTQKPVIAIELDKRLFEQINKKFSVYNNFKVINNDVLQVDFDELLNKYKNVIVIANLPYSITTPIVIKCLKQQKISSLYIMVQKEVGDKWDYKIKSNRNASTNILNSFYNIKKCFDIKNTSFNPVPKVDSSMMLLTRKNNSVYDEKFYSFLKTIFLAKRKKLLNNFSNIADKQKMVNILKELSINLNIRAEELQYEDLFQIYKLWS